MPENPQKAGSAPGKKRALVYLAAICGVPLLVSLLVAVFFSAGDAVRSSEPAKPPQTLTPSRNPAPKRVVPAQAFLPDDPKWGELKLALIEWLGARAGNNDADLQTVKAATVIVRGDSVSIGRWNYRTRDGSTYNLSSVSQTYFLRSLIIGESGFGNVRYVDGK